MSAREVATRYRAIADGMTRRVEGCGNWAAPTPCPGWTTLDVVRHVVEVHRSALSLLHDEDRTPAPDHVAGVVAAWRGVSTSMRVALESDERATGVVSTRFGDMPFEHLASRMICSDTLVHTWDLARATGQDEHLDPPAVEYAWTWMQVAGDNLRASGSFGPPVPPPADADLQTQLLCFLGRSA